MKTAPYDYILKTIDNTNILPVTSKCITGCIFCSHKNNPADIVTFCMPNLSSNQIKDLCEFLDKNKRIVIGESASRIIEGEPFLREDLLDILYYIRNKFKNTPIVITTSGNQLTKEKIRKLKEFEPIEINLSLNSSTKIGRELLFKGKHHENAVIAPKHLSDAGVAFNGSLVAMPDIAGYEDIEETVSFLSESGAQTVRVYVPGFSKFSEYDADFFEIRERLNIIADRVHEKYRVPILVEPPEINNLTPAIAGVIRNSPAQICGMEKGDIVLKVNDYKPQSRVDAYNRIYKDQNPKVTIKRKNCEFKATIIKEGDASAGAVFYYDLHPDTIRSIDKSIKRCNAKKPVIITSRLAYKAIESGIKNMSMFGDGHINILAVDNKYFGGTIMCAGLLTVDDIIDKLSASKEEYDLIILPAAPFDLSGYDLTGHNFEEIQDKLNIRAIIAE
ncbi:cyclic pyranopterin monophosphate synthase [Oxobacter pfennigii]|uniref:Cyclic pyranopterin monophosphate synthase n=1 Tax=Oxobacter pfennigii TaxID=36849 RepID=A0A0N8NT24_9CLOT|nr:DUF512 domain-containing protein [Oxobacter pfennigii]KPU43640.1 cyclic pyranopterin monophosphate synthase [Oxobacter pfennigii]